MKTQITYLTGKFILVGMMVLFLGKAYSQPCMGVVVYAGNDISICAVEPAQIEATSTVSSYTWSGGTGSYYPSSNSLDFAYFPSLAEINAGFAELIISTPACGGKIDTVRITINQADTPVISGPATVCSGDSNTVYSVDAYAGSSYDWTVMGGEVYSGQGTDSVYVKWNNSGPGMIYITQTFPGGCNVTSGYKPFSKHDFATNHLDIPTHGNFAMSYDANTESDSGSVVITSGCGPSKGMDLILPGGGFDNSVMCMSFYYQREESDAIFFDRGGVKLEMAGGDLYLTYIVEDGGGGSISLGPFNLNYPVPNDDIYRNYSFCYDSANGKAKFFVDSTITWTNKSMPGSGLYWLGAGDTKIGGNMDGNCSSRPFMDWVNFGIPIIIYPTPQPDISGADTLCYGDGNMIYQTNFSTKRNYSWSISGGSIISGSASNQITVDWTTSGINNVTVTETSTTSGCAAADAFSVRVNPKPSTGNILHD